MRLFLKYFHLHLKAQMEYRGSFLLLVFGQFLMTFTSILAVYLMMQRFYRVDQFSQSQVLLCAGINTLAFAIAELGARGFDYFPRLVRSGDFDRLLTRPQSLIFQVVCSQFEFSRLGTLLQSLLVMTYALSQGAVVWEIGRVVCLLLMILAGAFLYAVLFFLQACLSFFTLEALEVLNIFTYGAREFGMYQVSIYGGKLLRFLTYGLPLALVQYYPLLYLTGKSDNWGLAFLPLLAMVVVMPVYLLWQLGVRHYQSTGS